MTTNSPPVEPPLTASVPVPWTRVDRFVGQFIHDIRNGLNALELQLTLLGETATEPALQDEVKHVRASLVNLSRELQAVRVAVGPVSPRPVPYPAGELLEDLRERLRRRPGVETVPGTFTWHSDGPVAAAEVCVDPELIFDAIGRLLDNAISFRENRAGAIEFRASLEGANLLIRLLEAKTSPPPPDRLASWGNAPLETTRRGAQAYGLGLFRTRRIIEAHGGSLSAAHDAEAQCLETRITLPLASPDHPCA